MRVKGEIFMNTVEKFEKEINVKEYVEDYVNVEEFLEYCKACPNYEKVWSCPSYDFSPIDYWNRYSRIYIVARKIIFDDDTNVEDSSKIMAGVKKEMSKELYELEKQYEGSVSLSAGSCSLCSDKGCTRVLNKPCRHPELMRYSIESIGGNVGLTVSKLMGIELEWITKGKLPSYFVLVGGLLKK